MIKVSVFMVHSNLGGRSVRRYRRWDARDGHRCDASRRGRSFPGDGVDDRGGGGLGAVTVIDASANEAPPPSPP